MTAPETPGAHLMASRVRSFLPTRPAEGTVNVHPEPSATPERPPLAYPAAPTACYYGRGVYEMTEGARALVEGDDRRALAALSAYCRAGGYDAPAMEGDLRSRRALDFPATCGCEGTHASGNSDHECGVDCEFPGLPPCDDLYAWTVLWAGPDAPPAAGLPMLEMTW
jgi:hypothetical protein